METVTIILLDQNTAARHDLASRLRTFPAIEVGEADGWKDAAEQCQSAAIDLLICGIPDPASHCSTLLRILSGCRCEPVVLFYGDSTGLCEIEELCLRVGLRYLGHLPRPVDAERLHRAISSVRRHSRRLKS